MARPKKQKIKEKIVYPDVPFKAMLVEEPNVQNSLAINSVYDIVDVYSWCEKDYFVVSQDIRGTIRETYFLASRFEIIVSAEPMGKS